MMKNLWSALVFIRTNRKTKKTTQHCTITYTTATQQNSWNVTKYPEKTIKQQS